MPVNNILTSIIGTFYRLLGNFSNTLHLASRFSMVFIFPYDSPGLISFFISLWARRHSETLCILFLASFHNFFQWSYRWIRDWNILLIYTIGKQKMRGEEWSAIFDSWGKGRECYLTLVADASTGFQTSRRKRFGEAWNISRGYKDDRATF